MTSFSVEALEKGYHVYENIWTAVAGEEFSCMREPGNTFHPFAVAVMRDDTVIGTSHGRSMAPSYVGHA